MPAHEVEAKFEAQVFSPYSGLPADGEDGVNETDSTLLFVYYGDAGLFAFISDRLTNILEVSEEEVTIEDIQKAIMKLNGAFVLKVDTGWNGANSYGFAP